MIGLGAMGRFHLDTFLSLAPWVRVSAIADPTFRWSTNRGTGSGRRGLRRPDGMFGSRRIDAALVATADATHYGIVRGCVERQIPVLCEKPITTSPQESLDLVRAEQKYGTRLVQVGFMRPAGRPLPANEAHPRRRFAGTPMLVQHRNHNPSCAIDFSVEQLIQLRPPTTLTSSGGSPKKKSPKCPVP